jgi:hypothetical protein
LVTPAVVTGMMTNINTTTRKILQPVVLAVLMLFSTPLAGMLHSSLHPAVPAVAVANETVVFKSANTSVAFKS